MKRVSTLALYVCSLAAMMLATATPSWGGLTINSIQRNIASQADNGFLGGLNPTYAKSGIGSVDQTLDARDADNVLLPSQMAHTLASQTSNIPDAPLSGTLLYTLDATGHLLSEKTSATGSASGSTSLEFNFTITGSPVVFDATGSLLTSLSGGSASASFELIGGTTTYSQTISGAFHFTDTLGPGTYTLRMQGQTQVSALGSVSATADWDLDFTLRDQQPVVPEPGSALCWLSLALFAAAWRRKTKHQLDQLPGRC